MRKLLLGVVAVEISHEVRFLLFLAISWLFDALGATLNSQSRAAAQVGGGEFLTVKSLLRSSVLPNHTDSNGFRQLHEPMPVTAISDVEMRCLNAYVTRVV